MNEEWKDIKGYEGLYEVSNTGKVRNKNNGKERKFNEHHGYKRVTLSKNNKLKSRFVHDLVAETFIPNQDPKKIQVNHIDEDKTNNNISNLEWVTPKENANHGTRNDRLSECFKKGGSSYEKLQQTRKEKGLGRKKVRCVTTGKVFDSMREAGEFYKCCEKNIAAAAYGRRKSCGSLSDGTKLVWEFVKEDNTEVDKD